MRRISGQIMFSLCSFGVIGGFGDPVASYAISFDAQPG
jgi:hypothetical protein